MLNMINIIVLQLPIKLSLTIRLENVCPKFRFEDPKKRSIIFISA